MNGDEKAIAKLLVTYCDSFDEEVFKARLSEIPIKQVLRVGKERGGGALGVAEAMILAYNGKKKTDIGRLPIQKLYAKYELEAALIDVKEDKKVVAHKSILFDRIHCVCYLIQSSAICLIKASVMRNKIEQIAPDIIFLSYMHRYFFISSKPYWSILDKM